MSRKKHWIVVAGAMVLVLATALTFALLVRSAREKREAQIADETRRIEEHRAAAMRRAQELQAQTDALIAEVDARAEARSKKILAQVEALRAEREQTAKEARALLGGVGAATMAATQPAHPAAETP